MNASHQRAWESHTKIIRLGLAVLAFSLTTMVGGAVYGQSAQQIAQMKSQRMAPLGIQRLARAKSPYSTAPMGMRHVYPYRRPIGTRLEGVGYSAHSPAQAIRNACFYGRRPIQATGVVRGRDGYYATVYYR